MYEDETSAEAPRSQSLEETEIEPGWLRWAPPELTKQRDLPPVEKIALTRKENDLRAKAESRQELCWWCQKLKANRWVFEVGFDLKEDKAVLGQHTVISSVDYPGPVPGFCSVCWDAPRQLAQAVYYDRPEISLGVRPSRWFVRMTDGQLFNGECQDLANRPLPNIDTTISE